MSDLTEILRNIAKSKTRREEGEDWHDNIEWKAADTIAHLTRELAEARDKALEEAAKVAEAEVTGITLDRFIFNGEAAKNDIGDTSFVSTTRMSAYLRNRAAAIRALKEKQ